MQFAPLTKCAKAELSVDKTDTEYEVLTNIMKRAVENGETKYLSIIYSFGDYDLEPYVKDNFCRDPACRCSIFAEGSKFLCFGSGILVKKIKKHVREWGFLCTSNPLWFKFYVDRLTTLSSLVRDFEFLFSPWCLEYDRIKVHRLFEPSESKLSAFFSEEYLRLKALVLKRRDGWLREIDAAAHHFDCYEDGALAIDDLRRAPHVDIVAHFKTTEANARALNLLLCAHKHDAASRFHVDVFPLDMLKLVVRFAGLIPPRDPLYEQRTQLIAWKNKPCLCLK